MADRKTVVEGYYSVQNFYGYCQRENLEAPILEQLYEVLYHGKSSRDAILSLMMRQPREEV